MWEHILESLESSIMIMEFNKMCILTGERSEISRIAEFGGTSGSIGLTRRPIFLIHKKTLGRYMGPRRDVGLALKKNGH
jgi:hypothetical protein